METPPPNGNELDTRLLIGLRLFGMVLVAVAFPYAHLTLGRHYPLDGPHAPFMLTVLLIFSGGAALVYLAVSTLIYLVTRKQPPATRLAIEAILLIVFVLALFFAGITTHYS